MRAKWKRASAPGITLGAEIPPEARPDPRRPVHADPARARSRRRRRSAAAAAGRASGERARRSRLCRDRRAADADHPGDAEGDARRLSHPRSPRRRDRRPRRGRAIARPYRGSRHRAAGTIPRGAAHSQARQAAAADLLDQPRRRRPRVLGDARDRQQPCRRRRSTPRGRRATSSTISIRSAASSSWRRLAVILATHRDRPRVLPHHHPADARAGRPRRAHQPRRPRRVPAARPLRHARIRAAVAQLPRHGRAIGAALGLHRDLLGASHP